MAALGNELGDDLLRRAFADPELERAVRPVIGTEEFGAAPPKYVSTACDRVSAVWRPEDESQLRGY